MAHSKEPDAHVVLALAHISQQPVSTEHQNRPHSDLNSSENKLEKISWNHWTKKSFHFTKKWLNFTVACWNSGNWSSHLFDKNSVKTTFLLKSWFHEIFFGEKVFGVFHAVKCLILVIFYVKWRWKIQLFNNLTESNFRFGEFGTFSVSKKVQNLILQLLKLPKILISQKIQIAVNSESGFAIYFSQIQNFFTLTYQISVISRKISAAFIWGIFWFSPRFFTEIISQNHKIS